MLKRKNPDLVTDEQLGAVPQAQRREDIPIRKLSGSVKIKMPEGRIHFVIYADYLPKVGGIETAVYELAKLMDRKKYFVTIAYNRCESDEAMVKYSKVAKLVKLDDRRLDCDVCLLSSNHLQPQQIKAKAWLQWVHSDYEKYNNLQLVDNKDIFKYVAVSNHVAKVCKRMFGIKCEVIYNLLSPDFGKGIEKPIRFVTNSRLSPEKGFDLKEQKSKVVKFAELLKASGRNFTWTICGDNTHMPNEQIRIIDSLKHVENVNFVGYKGNILPTLIGADYLVQLSDSEGCPYSILEALQVGVPCIVTEWKGVEELIQDGVNGYIVRQDMKGIDIDKILNSIPKGFDTKPKGDISQWDKLIKLAWEDSYKTGKR
jgi:glycosyltransferase involved in cell wall biosynthesis